MSSLPARRSSPPGGRLPPLDGRVVEMVQTEMGQVESETQYEDAHALKLANIRKLREKSRKSSQPQYTFSSTHLGMAIDQQTDSWSNQYNYAHHEAAASPMTMSKALAQSANVNKPKFLKDLEMFLHHELENLGVVHSEPNEVRLQAHKEVFQYLIEDFKTYKPLLAAIKNEYEMMLRHQTQYIKQLQPLEQMLTTVTEQADKKIMRLRDAEKEEMLRVKKANEALQTTIDSIKNKQFSLYTQLERLKERLSEQYDRYRSEADARKLLVSDINDLKAQQEEMIYQQQQASNKDRSEDPVVIRQDLRSTRDKEKAATQQINDIIANYGDVLPKKDFLNLQKQFQRLTESMRDKSGEFDVLKAEHDTLLETHKHEIKTRDEYYQESERLRQTATPRPDWKRCGTYITGGASKWVELSEGKSSDQLVSLLLAEIAGAANDANAADILDPLGDSEDVPVHLRWMEPVKNRRFGKRDTMLLIKDVWREKDQHDIQSGGGTEGMRMPMSLYFIKYLKERFPTDEKMAFEWSYNIVNACQRFLQDDKIKLFAGVLDGVIDQELYFVQLQYIVSLLRALSKANEGMEPAGVFSEEQFKDLIRTFLDYQLEEDDLMKLVHSAKSELTDSEAEPSDQIEYTRLFFEDDEGKFGPFVDEFKKQLDNIRIRYIDNIIAHLEQKGLEQATPTDLETAIYQNDNQLPSAKIETLLLSAFKCASRADLEQAEALPFQAIKDCLLTRHIKRFCS